MNNERSGAGYPKTSLLGPCERVFGLSRRLCSLGSFLLSCAGGSKPEIPGRCILTVLQTVSFGGEFDTVVLFQQRNDGLQNEELSMSGSAGVCKPGERAAT